MGETAVVFHRGRRRAAGGLQKRCGRLVGITTKWCMRWSSGRSNRNLGNLSPNELLSSDQEGLVHIDAIEREFKQQYPSLG